MYLFGHNNISTKNPARANKGIIIIIIIITIIIIIIIIVIIIIIIIIIIIVIIIIIIIIIVIIIVIIIIIIIVVDRFSFTPYLVMHTLFRTNAVKMIKMEKINNVLTCFLHIFFLLV